MMKSWKKEGETILFGLTMREKVHGLLERAYAKEIGEYKRDMLETTQELLAGNLNGEQADQRADEALRGYIERVLDVVSGVIDGAPGAVSARFRMAIISPDLAGAPPHGNPPRPMGGSVYCFTYYAFTGRQGKSKDALYSNQRVRYYTDKALSELAEEHPELR